MNIRFYIYIILIALFFGCDTIDGDYIEQNAPFISDVYLFEFTGVNCPNCPEAHRIIDDLESKFGDRLHVISVHSGGFAFPRTSEDPDFRTEVGDEIHDLINSKKEYPSGSVMSLSEGSSISTTAWSTELGKFGWDRADVNIEYETFIDGNSFNVNVIVDFESDIEGNYSLCLYITENEVVGLQIDGGSKVEDYIHKHVLRTSMNGSYGTKLNTGSVFEKTFSVSINEEWEAGNLHLVPFVINTETKQVLTANLTKNEF